MLIAVLKDDSIFWMSHRNNIFSLEISWTTEHIRRRRWHPTPVLLPGKIPRTEKPGRLQSMGSRRVRHDWATSLSLFTFMHWRRKWQPTPVFLPRESQGRGSLVGCHLWGRMESDTTEATQQPQQQYKIIQLLKVRTRTQGLGYSSKMIPFLPCLSLLFFPQRFIKPPQRTTLPCCISFALGWF